MPQQVLRVWFTQPACGSDADIYPPLEDPAIGAKVWMAARRKKDNPER